MRKKVSVTLTLTAAAAAMCFLSSCASSGAGKDGQSVNSSSSGSSVSSSVLEDTYQTEYGTQLGTETESEKDEDEWVIEEIPEFSQSGAEEETSALTQETENRDMTEQSDLALQSMSGGKEEGDLTESQETEGAETESYEGPFVSALSEVEDRESSGEKWSMAYEDLSSSFQAGYHEKEQMQSASVIKLFIMGAVYQYMCYPGEEETAVNFGESYDGELRDTILSMITVSDNDAANRLVESLGQGDFEEGKNLVNRFCRDNGYTQTCLQRRFMASDLSQGDNLTSAEDVRKFYSDLFHGNLVNEEASGKMLDIVLQQTLKNKIPAGLPAGFLSGGKTGEMPEGYGLGCIENDSAIVFPDPDNRKAGYILVVLSGELAGKNTEAQNLITRISSQTAQWYVRQEGSEQTQETVYE